MKAVRSLLSRSVLAMIPLVMAIAACDDDDDPLVPSDVAGEYVADSATANAVFVVIEEGDTLDVLEEGGSIEIELNEDGTTTGRFFAPGLGEGGEDIDENLEGEWSLDDGVVTLDHDADTFLRDIEFEFVGNRLVADQTIAGGTRYRVVLVKQ